MATATIPTQHFSISDFLTNDHNSKILQVYLDTLKQYPNAQVLDLGPICANNIMFFAKKVKKLYVFDMFLHMGKYRREKLPTGNVWKGIDYQLNSFDGIHLWDFLDHIEDNEAVKLIDLCHSLLKPKGMLMVFSFDERTALSQINSFVIQDRYRLRFQLQPHIDLPWYFRNNRTLISLLSSFTSVNSYLYRNGLREFLFRRS